MKGEIEQTPMMQVFGALVAIGIILAMATGCQKRDNASNELAEITRAIDNLKTSSDSSTYLFLGGEHFAAIFSAEKSYMIHHAKKCRVGTQQMVAEVGKVPELNCLTNSPNWDDSTFVIMKPAGCDGNCVCLMKLEDEFLGTKKGDEIDITSTIGTEVMFKEELKKGFIIQDPDAKCSTVSLAPVDQQYLFSEIGKEEEVVNRYGTLLGRINAVGATGHQFWFYKDASGKVEACKEFKDCARSNINSEI